MLRSTMLFLSSRPTASTADADALTAAFSRLFQLPMRMLYLSMLYLPDGPVPDDSAPTVSPQVSYVSPGSGVRKFVCGRARRPSAPAIASESTSCRGLRNGMLLRLLRYDMLHL